MDRSSSFQNFLFSSDSLRTLSSISRCSAIESTFSPSDLDPSCLSADSSDKKQKHYWATRSQLPDLPRSTWKAWIEENYGNYLRPSSPTSYSKPLAKLKGRQLGKKHCPETKKPPSMTKCFSLVSSLIVYTLKGVLLKWQVRYLRTRVAYSPTGP